MYPCTLGNHPGVANLHGCPLVLVKTVQSLHRSHGGQVQSIDPVLGRRASTNTDAGFALRRYIEAASSIADNDSIGPFENDPDDAVEAFALDMREPPNVQESLHQAIILGRADLVRLLLSQGANLIVRQNYGSNEYVESSFLTAIEEGHEEVVKVILEEAANIPLMGVETQDDEDGEYGESANIPLMGVEIQDDEDGEYEEALWAAVSNRQIGVVKMLLAAQPGLPLRSATTLAYAVITGSTEIAQMLIENGAAVTPATSEDRVPLQYAADRVGIEPKKLLEYCCVAAETGNQSPSPYKKDFRRLTTPLCFAASAGHAAMVDELLNAGADTREDVSILHAVYDPSIVAQLLAADAKLHPNSERTLLNVLAGFGDDTVLGSAARGGNVPWMKELLSLGADPAARNGQGLTPREIVNGIDFLVSTGDVQEVLAKAEEHGHRIPI
ncbi:MAG: hypothetical protein LQ337_008808, partial [Flavoplaca oasis]